MRWVPNMLSLLPIDKLLLLFSSLPFLPLAYPSPSPHFVILFYDQNNAYEKERAGRLRSGRDYPGVLSYHSLLLKSFLPYPVRVCV